MATLLVSAAVNVSVGLALQLLFPSKGSDTSQTGPRLSDLDVTSSAYGQPIPVHYGTIRTSGNVIWSPGKEEVAVTETQESQGAKGGGGGGSASLTTFTYFASFAVGFAEGVADEVLRIWADGKLIYDKTGAGLDIGGVKFKFYPGDEDQLPDALIEADKGVGNVPAHRGLVYIVFERMPLANFGNRIPNITAEITFNGTPIAPFQTLTELASANVPGSTTGADQFSHMFLRPFTDELYMLNGAANGISRSSVASMSMQVQGDGGLLSHPINFCMNGYLYMQPGSANWVPFQKWDPVSFEVVQEFGITFGLGSFSVPFNFPNGSWIGVLPVPRIGAEPVDIIVISANGAVANGGFHIYKDEHDGNGVQLVDIRQDVDIGSGGPVIQDHHNNRLFNVQQNSSTVDLYEITASLDVGSSTPTVTEPVVRLVGSYSKGGVDLAGTGNISGWCVLPDEEAIILANSSSMFKLDMDSGDVLATNLTLGMRSYNQWSDNGMLAFGNGKSGTTDGGVITTINTEDLSVQDTQDVSLSDFGGSLESNYPKQAYDPRSHSLIFSRINGSNPSTNHVVRVLLDRHVGDGVSLASIVSDLSDRAGLSQSEIDVTGLSADTVLGFSVTRQSTVRQALEPLQRGFLFEGFESDFKMKFIKRGGSSVLSIPSIDVGRLSNDASKDFISEVRAQEVELPMRVSVRYSDRDKDYQQGSQSDKRVQNPTPSMSSGEELTLDLPIVMTADPAKQLAQRWLYTSWAERDSIKSELPWRYARLDPTDIFELTLQGDIRRLRMAQLEVGADLVLEFLATQEDASSDLSDLAADGGLGFITQIIPSGFPTKWLPLDLPLLGAGDAAFQQFSRSYYGAAGYDLSWPGTQLFQSRDNGATYQEVGDVSLESAWGSTVGAIAAPLTTYTWDESSIITVRVQRGLDRFVTSTDEAVLNGANAIAVSGPNGPEIIQFVNVTQVDVSTVQLSRLLRGRRGTDISELTDVHATGERVVLLEQGRVMTFQLPLSLIGSILKYRPVTLGTMLEDAPELSYAYTAQDLIPYSVEHITAERPANDLNITWVRRTRFNGELRDGTGIVPLNEGTELYEIDFYDVGLETPFLTRTGITSPSTTLTIAEYNAATGGSLGEVPSLDFRIYQISEIVGRGRSERVSVTLPAATVDPDFASVILLAAFDGADADQTPFVEDSPSGHTITFVGNAQLDTAFQKFGSASLLCDGSGDYCSVPDSPDWDLGTDLFTIEGFIRATAAGNNDFVFGRTTGGTGRYVCFTDSDGFLKFSTAGANLQGTSDINNRGFIHFAIVRDVGDVFSLYVDGIREHTVTTATTITSSADLFYIGSDPASLTNRSWLGSIDEFRFTRGVARYSGPTLSIPSSPFPRA